MNFSMSQASQMPMTYPVGGAKGSKIEVEDNLEVAIDPRLLRHDLLAPLRTIDALADFLTTDIEEGKLDNIGSHVERIRAATKASRSLVDGVVRFEQAGRRQAVEAVQIERLARRAVADFEVPDNITIVIRVDASCEDKRVFIERQAVEEALRELFDNALVHRTRNRGSISISVSLENGSLKLNVSDDGAGIKVEYHEVVFQPLRKIRHNDTHKGPGLGLSIVEALATTHGGSISIVRSSPSGTEVELVWPVAEPRRLTSS